MGRFRNIFRLRRNLPRDLLVLTESPTPLPLGRSTLEAELEVGLVTVDAGGRRVLPAFRNEEALLAWRPEGGPFLGLYRTDLVELILRENFDGLIIDPAGPEPRELSRDELLSLV